MNKVEELAANYSIDELQDALLSLVSDKKYKNFKALTDTTKVSTFCKAYLANSKIEKFVVLFCNNQHEVIHVSSMFTGTIDACGVYPAEIARKALHIHASAVFIAHNHPSGLRYFSQADKTITKKIYDSLKLLDIRFLDHILVCKEDDKITTKSIRDVDPFLFG